jgi:hypothetical protein
MPSVLGPEGVLIPSGKPLAPPHPAGRTVDGIPCQTSEQLLFHIHAHLAIFVDGKPRQVPPGVGIPGAQADPSAPGTFIDNGTCFYWLHTHAADGIIHIESPVQRTYTVGEFFDIWREPLSANQLGPVRGPVTAYLDGRRYRQDPRTIPLTDHAQVQLSVGRPAVKPESIIFPPGM